MGFDWITHKNYKRHYICLACQKGFKRPSKEDMKYTPSTDLSNLMAEYYDAGATQDILTYINTAHQKLKVVCPNCQGQMIQVHYNFEVPPQRDHNTWKKLRKDMSSSTIIRYDIYIHWHRLALQKAIKNSALSEQLKENLSILESL